MTGVLRILRSARLRGDRMRKTTASLSAVLLGVAAVALLLGAGPAGAALATSAPLVQECSAATNGGSLVNGVCDLPGAVVGGDYYSYINASNNDAADRFSIVSGSLPPGLTMPAYLGVADTVIEGDATEVGTYTFVVHAADPNGGLSSNQTYSITAADLACSADSNGGTATGGVCVLPAAAVGQQYAAAFAYASGTGGSFTVTGTLPPGLSTSGTTVAGSPTQQGTFTFAVTESAQTGPPLQETYSITVGPPLPLTDTTEELPPGAGTVGTVYSAGFTLSGGEGPYTWSQVSGQLPPGLALASSGAPGQTDNVLTGTPTTAGTYVFTMQVTDTLGDTASGQVSITINPRPPLKISEPSAAAGPAGTVGTTYTGIGFAATGGQTPYTWTVATGQVPPGLAIHTPSSYQRHTFPGADIILTGTPTTAGTFKFIMKVTDSLGDTATQSISITIKA
jgi:hypothetical protein